MIKRICYGPNKSGEQAITKAVEVEMYHNNGSSKTLRFGILVYNSGTSSITIEKRYVHTVTDSVDKYSQSDKVSKCAILERDFANRDYKIETVTIGAKSYGFALAVDVPKEKLICARMRLTLKSGTAFYVRTVVCSTSTSAKDAWTNANESPANQDVKNGQFSGIVEYRDKFVDVELEEYGDYFEIFNTGSSYGIDPTKPISEVSIPVEFYKPLFKKNNSKPVFDGNYGVAYKLGFSYPGKKGGYLKITPHQEMLTDKNGEKYAANLYAKVVIKDPNYLNEWYVTEILQADEKTGVFLGEGAWFYRLPISEDGSKREGRDMQIILPGGNFGVLKIEYVEKAK